MENQSLDGLTFEQILTSCRGLIATISGGFPERYREDLQQEGSIGLFAAYETYSPASGVPFKSYAALCIRRRMISAYRKLSRNESDVSLENTEVSDIAASPEEDMISSGYIEYVFNSVRHLLTDLERNVLSAYLAYGDTSVVAGKLGLAPKQVDNAMTRVKKKLRDWFAE